MTEQTIILIFFILALGATLWLYFLKAKKQVLYKGDELADDTAESKSDCKYIKLHFADTSVCWNNNSNA